LFFFDFIWLCLIFVFIKCDFFLGVLFDFSAKLFNLCKSPLFEFDLEIERTLHKIKRQRALLIASESEMVGGEEA